MTLPRGFLSYAHEDVDLAERVFGDLEREGVAPWFDRRHFSSGEDVDSQILNAIKESWFFLVILTPTSVSKEGYVRKEVKLALELRGATGESPGFLIPVRFGECCPRPEEVGGLAHFIDLVPDWKQGMDQVLSLVNARGSAASLRDTDPQAVQAMISDLAWLESAAVELRTRTSITLLLANALRMLRSMDPSLLGRKVLNLQAGLEDMAACLELHYVERCGALVQTAACVSCGGVGGLVAGHADVGGWSMSDYNDNYITFCTRCYRAWHHSEIDYLGLGPRSFHPASNEWR